ncbi:MAG: hypothetical protein D6797_06760 [Bdellovibrio sp.]|nr:MAG: hypothetical protein D6797_06760 [Bdellovibrio sp.]
MKKYLITLITFWIPWLGIAETSPTNYWVNEVEKTITVAPPHLLKVEIIKMDDGTDEVYSTFEIKLELDKKARDRQLDEIQEQYPGYNMQTANLLTNGPATLKIPPLQTTKRIELTPGQEAPYFYDLSYLTKDEYFKIMQSYKKGSFPVELEADEKLFVKTSKVVEQKTLSPQTCSKLVNDDPSLFSFILGLEKLYKSIHVQFQNTKKDLIKSVFQNCYRIDMPQQIDRFEDLMDISFTLKKRNKPLVGRTLKTEAGYRIIPLQYTHQLQIL